MSRILTLNALLLAVTVVPTAVGQQVVQPSAATPVSYQRLSGQRNPAIQYFGGGQVRPATTAAPMRVAAAPQLATSPVSSKPFSHVRQGPTISPYLSLDLIEGSTSLPNYFAYVRPQQERLQELDAQQAQLQRMQQQLQREASLGGAPNANLGNRFLNTGGYFQVKR